jgi:AhpD family alkylhydroperoxidase
MARIPYPIEMSPETQQALDRLPPLGLFRMVANAPTALRPFLRYGGVLLADLELHPALREMAILRVAALTDCTYEETQHREIALAVGASRAQLDAALGVAPPTSESDTIVLALVDEAVGEHGVHAETLEAAQGALGPRATVELLLVVGHYLAIAVLANSVALEPDDPSGSVVLDRARRQVDDRRDRQT